MTEEKQLFELLEEHQNNDLKGVGIHIQEWISPDFKYVVYHSDGYCFISSKEIICEPKDTHEFDESGLEKDGCVYTCYNPYDGFEEINNTRHAIDLIKNTINGA